MGSTEKATKAYELTCSTIEMVNGKGTTETKIQQSQALGQNILREELGIYGDWDGPNYNLTEGEKSRLLAHIRQDVAATNSLAANGLEAAMDAQKIAKQNKTRLNIIIALLITNLLMTILVFG